ncbi:hypothetical protein ACFWIB_28630 [Streptomyces sp. NPDC127051]|uniref:hypothetical protein n=1 Tax=Streptomyces sp. NPDC127051 TaxID=3347119 RepID=UPI00365AAD80
MPNSTTTDRILRDTLSRAAAGTIDTITDDGRLEQDIGTAGPALAELVTDLEERLSVVIPDEETGRLHTVADLRALLARLAPSGTDAS